MSLKQLFNGNEDKTQVSEHIENNEDETANAEDDEAVTQRELAKAIRNANSDFERADDKLEAYKEKMQTLLEQGSQTENSDKRRMLALLIRQVKQRAAVMNLKQQASLRDLFKYTLQKEVQDIEDMLEDELNRESPMDEFEDSTDEFVAQFNQVAASVHSQTEEMNDVLQELSTSVSGAKTSMSVDTLPEEEQMDRIAEEEIDIDQLELDIEEDLVEGSSGEFLKGENSPFDQFDHGDGEFAEKDGAKDLATSLAE